MTVLITLEVLFLFNRHDFLEGLSRLAREQVLVALGSNQALRRGGLLISLPGSQHVSASAQHFDSGLESIAFLNLIGQF